MAGMSVERKTETVTVTVTEVKEKLSPPRKWRVVLLNDDVTTMNFVVNVLCEIFNYEKSAAIRKMLEVHTTGRGVAGVYPKSVAAMKCQQCRSAALEAGYPFRVIMEEDHGGEK